MSGKFCAVCLEKNVRWVSLHRFALAVGMNLLYGYDRKITYATLIFCCLYWHINT